MHTYTPTKLTNLCIIRYHAIKYVRQLVKFSHIEASSQVICRMVALNG